MRPRRCRSSVASCWEAKEPPPALGTRALGASHGVDALDVGGKWVLAPSLATVLGAEDLAPPCRRVGPLRIVRAEGDLHHRAGNIDAVVPAPLKAGARPARVAPIGAFGQAPTASPNSAGATRLSIGAIVTRGHEIGELAVRYVVPHDAEWFDDYRCRRFVGVAPASPMTKRPPGTDTRWRPVSALAPHTATRPEVSMARRHIVGVYAGRLSLTSRLPACVT